MRPYRQCYAIMLKQSLINEPTLKLMITRSTPLLSVMLRPTLCGHRLTLRGLPLTFYEHRLTFYD